MCSSVIHVNICWIFQTVGTGSGVGTLEVLYEDPKEDLQSDVLSILSCSGINDDDKKQLIEEITSGNTDSGTNLRSNLNAKLNTRNIFSKFTFSNSNVSNDDSSSITNENESADQKTEDEIVLAKSWAALDEEMRDVHHLINEFSHIVVSIFILWHMTTRQMITIGNHQNLSI